jgi:ribonuclease P protein component
VHKLLPGIAWVPLGKTEIEALLGTRPVAKTDHFVLHCQVSAVVASELCTECAPDRDDSVDNSKRPVTVLDAPCGFATLVPKRHAKRAVTRNLIRRQMRELLRNGATTPPASKCLIRLRAPFDGRRYPAASSVALRAAVRQELSALLAQRQATPWQ